LPHVVRTLHPPRRLACGLDGGQEQGNEYADNGDDNQQLHEGKAGFAVGVHGGGGSEGRGASLSWGIFDRRFAACQLKFAASYFGRMRTVRWMLKKGTGTSQGALPVAIEAIWLGASPLFQQAFR
jgi:hypothetical protein